MTGFPWGAVFEVALRTLAVCGSALIIALVLGLPLGIWLDIFVVYFNGNFAVKLRVDKDRRKGCVPFTTGIEG